MTRGKKRALVITGAVIVIAFLAAAAYAFMMWRIVSNEEPRFWEGAVAKIEARYGGNPPQGAVLFTGSSSIDFWNTLERDMAPLTVLNHGIGGTKMADMTYYAGRLVAAFHPKAVVVYAGSNDINGFARYSRSGEELYRLTVKFFDEVRALLPEVPIYYISISPSKARWSAWKDADEANRLIRAHCARSKKLVFIDATPSLLGENGLPRDDIFRMDGLHFNEKGYALWTSLIRPVLVRDLAR
jgi:lysophospholipase L1-like esterase